MSLVLQVLRGVGVPLNGGKNISLYNVIRRQYSIDHQPQSIQEDLNQQMMNDVHNKWDDMIESKNELLQSLGEILQHTASTVYGAEDLSHPEG
ncbi:hypothetical protein Tco_1222146 [Tanacetum coccineum]